MRRLLPPHRVRWPGRGHRITDRTITPFVTGEGSTTIGMMQQLVESQADGWRHATDEVSRFFEAVAGSAPPDAVPDSFTDVIGVPFPAAIDAMAGMPGMDTAPPKPGTTAPTNAPVKPPIVKPGDDPHAAHQR